MGNSCHGRSSKHVIEPSGLPPHIQQIIPDLWFRCILPRMSFSSVFNLYETCHGMQDTLRLRFPGLRNYSFPLVGNAYVRFPIPSVAQSELTCGIRFRVRFNCPKRVPPSARFEACIVDALDQELSPRYTLFSSMSLSQRYRECRKTKQSEIILEEYLSQEAPILQFLNELRFKHEAELFLQLALEGDSYDAVKFNCTLGEIVLCYRDRAPPSPLTPAFASLAPFAHAQQRAQQLRTSAAPPVPGAAWSQWLSATSPAAASAAGYPTVPTAPLPEEDYVPPPSLLDGWVTTSSCAWTPPPAPSRSVGTQPMRTYARTDGHSSNGGGQHTARTATAPADSRRFSFQSQSWDWNAAPQPELRRRHRSWDQDLDDDDLD